MRKLGLLAAAAGLALSGSMAKADFVLSYNKTVGPVIGTQTTDVYDFILTNTGTNGTGTGINSIDIGMTSNLGMYIGVRSGGRGDVFYTTATSALDSWISDQAFNTSPASTTSGANGNLTTTAGGNILLMGQSVATDAGGSNNGTTYTANELVQGISGAIASSSGPDASPLWFARAVVPTGAVVTLWNPGGTATAPTSASNRAFEPNSGVVSPLAGNFAPTNDSGTSGPFVVPEPSSLALFGIGAAGLLARRRRTA